MEFCRCVAMATVPASALHDAETIHWIPDASMPEIGVINSGSSHVVVIGGGWGGWGAAKALCEAGARHLIDGMTDPTGRTPMHFKWQTFEAAPWLLEGLPQHQCDDG